MRVRTLAAAALAAATLTIGGSAAAFASTPAPPPPGAKGTVKVFSCKDGVIKVEETRLVDAGESGVVFALRDGESAAGSAQPRLHVTQAVPADGPTFDAVPAQPLPEGVAGVLVTRVHSADGAPSAGAERVDAVPFVEPKEGGPCSALAVPALPAK